jgi:hypothetical protein
MIVATFYSDLTLARLDLHMGGVRGLARKLCHLV